MEKQITDSGLMRILTAMLRESLNDLHEAKVAPNLTEAEREDLIEVLDGEIENYVDALKELSEKMIASKALNDDLVSFEHECALLELERELTEMINADIINSQEPPL